jgi:hypothetical protein
MSAKFLWLKGMIREDTWIRDFTKDMLVKVATNSGEMQLRDLHADMDCQITRTNQLCLVDCCYDSHVITIISAMAKSNVVTGYTLSSQIGSRGSDSRGIMISHCFVKAIRFLGEGKDVDHFVHNHGKVHRFPKTIYLRLKRILSHLKTFRLHPKDHPSVLV